MSTIAVLLRGALRRKPGTIGSAWSQPLALTGIALAGAWILVAIFVPLIAPYDPLAQTSNLFAEPSTAHLFGTDELGRDVPSRVREAGEQLAHQRMLREIGERHAGPEPKHADRFVAHDLAQRGEPRQADQQGRPIEAMLQIGQDVGAARDDARTR